MKLTPMAVCLTRTWPDPGGGSSIFSSLRTLGPPTWSNRIAFIAGSRCRGGYRERRKIVTVEFGFASTPSPSDQLPADKRGTANSEDGAKTGGFNLRRERFNPGGSG